LGPFYHTYGVQFKYFQQYNLIDPTAVDYIAYDLIKVSEVIEFQRQYAPESYITMKKAKERGLVCIFHLDDNVWEIPPGNPAATTYQPGSPVLGRFEMLMEKAHAVSTSTPYLAKLSKRLNPNVYLYRNLVDPEIETFKSPGRDNPEEIRIGWTGTPHHHDDIVPVEPIFPELVKNCRVKLIFMGYAPPTILKDIKRDRWEYYDFVPVDYFYPAFTNLDFDIGLAPLIENGFNKGKTARKAQEYAICRIPMVLAPIVTYVDWKHGETCLKPKENNPEGWLERIQTMIDSTEKEKDRLTNNAYDQVVRNHNVHKYIWERAAFYYKVYKETRGEEHPHSNYVREGLKERGLEVDF